MCCLAVCPETDRKSDEEEDEEARSSVYLLQSGSMGMNVDEDCSHLYPSAQRYFFCPPMASWPRGAQGVLALFHECVCGQYNLMSAMFLIMPSLVS